jgi:hypothetical protein
MEELFSSRSPVISKNPPDINNIPDFDLIKEMLAFI